MQENRFEKQVREQLEELQFHPTAPVWENVAASIRRRKRRRIAAYFSIIALLGIGTWFALDGRWNGDGIDGQQPMVDGRKANSLEKKSLLMPPASGLTSDDSLLPPQVSALTPDSQENDDRLSIVDDRKEKSLNNRSPLTPQASGLKPDSRENDDRLSIVRDRKGKSLNNKSPLTPQASRPASDSRESDDRSLMARDRQEKSLDNKSPLTPDASHLTSDDSRLMSDDSPLASHDSRVTADDSFLTSHDSRLTVERPHEAPASQQVSKRKIAWAVEVSGGMGRRQNEVLPGIGASAEKIDLYQGSGVWAPPASFAVVRVFPSPSNTGPAFSVGASARIPVTKKINLVAGLRYQYQSEKIQVGIRKDTNVQIVNAASAVVDARSVYNGPAYFDYTNRYHFIQAPVGVEFQLNRGRKTPLFWELGAAPGYLIASNALVYDTAFNGIYYKDKSLLNKFHLTGSTSLSIQFGNKGPFKWTIGPELRMNVTPLGESKYDNRQYLIYGGLRARIFLK